MEPIGPGCALPHITPEEFAQMQKRREDDPNWLEKLLARAKAEFDEKWGIDPTSDTDYDSRI